MTEAAAAQSESHDAVAIGAKLTASTARRIGHQIERSVNGTFGARDGLRELVHLGAQQMLDAGASRDSIRREIAQCVSNLPPTTISAEPARSRHLAEMEKLKALMVSWTDECRSTRAR